MRGGHGDRRHAVAGRQRAGGGDADGGVRVGEVAGRRRAGGGFPPACRRRRGGSRGTARAPRCQAASGTVMRPVARKSAMVAAVAAASRSSSSNSRRSKLELTWMSMLGDRLGSTGRAPTCRWRRGSGPGCRCGWSRRPGARSAAPCAAPPRRRARCRNCRWARERDLAVRRAERQRGGDVIRHLRRDARPVDRVHRREVHLGAERRVGEHRLHQVLAVVEVAVDGDVGDVGGRDRRHLPALHLAGAAVRDAG